MQIKKSNLIFVSILLGIFLVAFVSARLPTKIIFIQPPQEPTLGTYYPECSEIPLRAVPDFESEPYCYERDCLDPAQTGKNICNGGNTVAIETCRQFCVQAGNLCEPPWNANAVSNCQGQCTLANTCV